MSARELLLEIYRAALDAVRAGPLVARCLREEPPPPGPVTVLSCGKAACGMAEGALEVLGDRIRAGIVYTKEGHGRGVPGMRVREAAHPLPDPRSREAALEALEAASSLNPGEVLLVLISGGASSLWTAPAAGVGLEHKRRVSELLLRAGVDIVGFNTVRKHLSEIKGGWLARRAYPASLLTLAVSDVRGNPPEAIGSGPTVPDPTTFADALRVLRGADLLRAIPAEPRLYLEEGADGRRPETPKPGEQGAEEGRFRLVATLDDALRAAAEEAERRGLRVWPLGASLYGEARAEGQRLARLVQTARERRVDLIVVGGEPTVRVTGAGIGGRAQETALAFALESEGERVAALFAGTDGTDGPTDAAGAIVDGESVSRARGRGMDPWAHLDANDAYPLLERSGDLLRTGPTDTNVADLMLIRVLR